MTSPTRWTWVWVNSGSWWWTGRPGVLWFMGSQRVGHNWVTELNWTENVIVILPVLLSIERAGMKKWQSKDYVYTALPQQPSLPPNPTPTPSQFHCGHVEKLLNYYKTWECWPGCELDPPSYLVDDSGWFLGLQPTLTLAVFIVLGCAWGWEDA